MYAYFSSFFGLRPASFTSQKQFRVISWIQKIIQKSSICYYGLKTYENDWGSSI